MASTTLATAIELARIHGVRFAASYLCEAGIDLEVALEVLAQRSPALLQHSNNGAQNNGIPRMPSRW